MAKAETTLPDGLVPGKIPHHIAIIMDGNGRWAKQRSLPRIAGHREGINSVREIVRVCGELGVKILTLYTFSSENWRRPRQEVSALMRLLLVTINREVADLNRNNVRLTVIGRINDLPEKPRQGILNGIEALKNNTGLNLNLALSYGGRQEILDAVRDICRQGLQEVTEQEFSRHLYTADIPDPDLLIRTSGELRLSNFLLWQLAYTEIYVTEVLWPDFRRAELVKAILAYQGRERRFGRVSEQLDAR
ncbi:MAG: isoprenyl transferase [Candidatus Zixiibacteriota bacterium]|nr:MAG: isoprenyl transferase [candidate division Zixibacteria bacterium]